MHELFMNYVMTLATSLCFFMFIRNYKSSLMGNIFRYFIAGNFLVLGVVATEFCEACFAPPIYEQANWQRYVFAILAYILRPAIAYILLLVFLKGRKTKYRLLLMVPLIVNVIFLLISPFCGIVFSFNETNNYIAGPLSLLPAVIGGIYLTMFLVFSAIRTKKEHSSELIPAISIVIMCFLAIYLESRRSIIGALPQASIIGMTFYYMFFAIIHYNTDSLTDAYGRSKFHVDSAIDGLKYLIIFDVNGLKLINDNQGHAAGDASLQSFSHSIKSVLPLKATIYRIGGDELAILYFGATEQDVVSLLEKIENSVDPKKLPYGYSYGYDSYTFRNEFNSAYKIADKMMYDNKNTFWAKYKKEHNTIEPVR